MSPKTKPTLADEVAERAEAARREVAARDEAILAMLATGASQREVARAAGLSHTRVQQIAKRAAA